MDDLKRRSDVYVQTSSKESSSSLPIVARRLVACLFYIKLLLVPAFYATLEFAHVLLRCRLTEGKQLLCLLKGLHRLRARVYHRGDEAKRSSELLITQNLLNKCRKGKPFFKHLRIKVNKLQTKLKVKIDGIAGGQEYISNCPYQLNKLITDQGLNQIFGSKNHRISNKPPDPKYNSAEDLTKLRDTLDNIIISYSQ